MANKANLADHLRTNSDDAYWHFEQVHYSNLKPRRSVYEPRQTQHIADDELLAFLSMALDAFNLPQETPVAPKGMPGVSLTPDETTTDMIRAGARYLAAYVKGERRTLCNAYLEVQETLREARRAGYDAAIKDMVKRDIEASEKRAEDTRTSEVYFIKSGEGPIKIGLAKDVEARCKNLQTAHSAPLSILATVGGGIKQEREYHKQFAEHRLHGEWFHPAPDILAEIERLQVPA